MNTEISKNMNLFIGTKVIKASTEMSRREYCTYRGWKLPDDKNGEDRVYLVEYEKDPSSPVNHPNHEGYISMSPKEVFEKNYIGIKYINDINKDYTTLLEHQKRVVDEAFELYDKIIKLNTFVLHKKIIFNTLPEDEQNRMLQQLKGMQYYFSILVERINHF